MADFKNLTIEKAGEFIKSGKISVKDLASYYLENIKKKNREINAYLEIFEDVFDEAEKMDKTALEEKKEKPLFGLPIALKDNILIEGKKISAASRILENYTAGYDAGVVKKLKNAGALFLGRTNMDEFAMGSSTENSAFSATKNPYDESRVAGGSSGGSAAAVAGDMALAALGSDTGGSVRQPSAFCGVVGLKPTYGSVSRSGLIAMASSLDQIGPITKTVGDAKIVFDIIKGKDPADSTSVESEIQNSRLAGRQAKFSAKGGSASGGKIQNSLNIGVPKEYFNLEGENKGVDKDLAEKFFASVEKLKKSGHEVKQVSLPHTQYVLSCYYIIMPAEVSANLSRFDGVRYGLKKPGKNLIDEYFKTRSAGFGREVKTRIILGTYVLSSGYYDAYYSRAQKVRTLIKKDFEEVFSPEAGKVDVLITPVTPEPAFKIGEKTGDPVKMYLSDIFTVSVNLAGVPAISVPNGFVEKQGKKLPSAIQVIAPWFEEEKLFYLGRQLENNS